jgi:hypothetical protein
MRFAGSLSIQLVKLASITDSGFDDNFTHDDKPPTLIKSDLDQK